MQCSWMDAVSNLFSNLIGDEIGWMSNNSLVKSLQFKNLALGMLIKKKNLPYICGRIYTEVLILSFYFSISSMHE